MKRTLLALAAVALVMTSCQKEISVEDPNSNPGGGGTGGGTSNGTQLIRVGTRSGSDSLTREYTYNASNKITGYRISGTSNGQAADATITYNRNASGIITSEVYKSPSLAQYQLDSVETKYTYDAANNRYQYSLTRVDIPLLGLSLKDSVVYTYDAGGKLTAEVDYADEGTGYTPFSKVEYTYSGSNIASIKYYSYDDQAAAYDLDETDSYEYDTKTNPLQFTADAVVFGMSSFYPANNPVKITAVDPSSSQTVVRNIVYTYNNAGRPATSTSSSGSSSATSTYYYK